MLGDLIKSAMSLCEGEEFILYYIPPYSNGKGGDYWIAGICNTGSHVMMFESAAKYEADAPTAEEAVKKLIDHVINGVEDNE